MSALFPPRANEIVRVVLVAAGILLIGLPIGVMAWARTPQATGKGEAIAQPIPFDHRVHVTGMHIDCRYCHAMVDRAPMAGLPPTTACVACHNPVWMNSPQLAPVRTSLATGRPITWQRVTRIPGFVYFDHSVHVAKGIGCESCHGRVDQMSQVTQAVPLTMGWCLECHRDPAAYVRPRDQVTTMGWVPPQSQAILGPQLVKAYGVHSFTNCSACHR